MKELAFATIKELRILLDNKEISREELLDNVLACSTRTERQIDALLELFDKESILAAAQQYGPLAGIPGIIKDNIAQKGRGLSCASQMLKNFVSPYDATVIERLKRSGAFLLGRANMDEFAMGSSTETSAFKKTKNPWDLSRVPGGSSGGSIAAVAAGMVPWALGSETGGSVRQPAAFCGVFGLKPTYGLLSRYGLVAYASGLDQIGITTRTAYDTAVVLSVVAGVDPKDATTKKMIVPDYTQLLTKDIKGLKIGVITNAVDAPGIDQQVHIALKESLAVFENLGARIVPVQVPTMDYAAAVYFILSRAQAASNLARFDGVRYTSRSEGSSLQEMYNNTRHDGFGKEVRARIMIGNYVLSAGNAEDFYGNAKKVQCMIQDDFNRVFKDVDILFTPTAPTTAFRFEEFAKNTFQMDLQDYFTCPINLAGIPAVSVPCGFSTDDLPIGMQLIAPHFAEGLLLRVADAFEASTDWHTKKPVLPK